MKFRQRQESINHILTVTATTRELDTPQYILEIIQPFTNYQVIPSPLITNYSVDTIILAALPASQNKLIDIALPLILTDINGYEINYFGRYLIYNCRLIGIKLSSSTKEEVYITNTEFRKWKSGTSIKFKVPNLITNYYRRSRFPEGSYKNQIPVGDFMVNIGNTKICLLFESQIQEKQAILTQCKRLECQIFSIICDVPRDNEQGININNVKLNTKNQNMLKRFGKQNNRIVMYAGPRMSTPRYLFLSNSFIFHPHSNDKNEQNMEQFFFNDAVSLSIACNLGISINSKQYRSEKIHYPKNEVIEETAFLSYAILAKQGLAKKFYANGRRQLNTFSKSHGDLLKKLKLWFLFNSDNRKKPFIFPLPLSEKMRQVLTQLQTLSKFLQMPITDFVVLYNKDRFSIQIEQYQRIPAYRDFQQLCQKCQDEVLNIYTDDQQNYQYLVSRAYQNSRLRVYYNYIEFKEEKEFRVVKQKSNKLNQFATYILNNGLTGYHRLLTQARSQLWKLNKRQQIDAITINLVGKLRANMSNNSFYKSLLKKSMKQIQQEMQQAEIKLINTTEINIMIQSKIQSSSKLDQEVSIQSSEKQKQKQFLGKMKEMRRSQSKQMRNIELVCHKCKIVYNKQYFYRCSLCNNKICYICSSQVVGKKDIKSRKQLLDSLRCIVCNKICNCTDCQNKIMKPQRSLDLSFTLKMAQNSTVSLAIQAQNKKTAGEICMGCLMSDRKTEKIKVACSTCDYQECLACVRSQRTTISLNKEWQCSKCQPDKAVAPQLIVDDKQESKQEKGMDVEPQVLRSQRPYQKSPPKYNQNNRFNNNNRSYQDNNRSNNFVRNNSNNNQGRGRSRMIDQNEEKKSRSASRSNSIPRNKNKASEKQRSLSRSKSPKRTNIRKPSPQSNNNNNKAQRVNNWNNKPKKSRSVSVSQSPKRDVNKKPNNKDNKSGRSNSGTPPRKAIQRKRSNSGSGSRTPPKNTKKRSQSRSKKSKSRSYSRSRSKSRDRNVSNDFKGNQDKPQKLWNRQNKWEGNNYNNNQRFDNNRGGRGGRGGRGRGGFDRNQGNYDRDRNQGNYDRNRGDNNRRDSYNNNNRDRDTSRNGEQSMQNNQIVASNKYESNDVDY